MGGKLRRGAPPRPAPPPKVDRRCRECANAYGPHEMSVRGELFMLHCREREPWSVIRDWPACAKFKPRADGGSF